MLSAVKGISVLSCRHWESSGSMSAIHSLTTGCVSNRVSPSAYLCDAGTGERHDHGHYVDGQLELQELGDAVVDVPPPHDGLDDAGEVVVRQDDVGRLLRHVCASDSLTRSRYIPSL